VGWKTTIAALLGISAYSPAPSQLPGLDDPGVERARASMGGQLQAYPVSRTRWYLADLESATHAANTGQIAQAAQLMDAASADGVLAGVLSTRTGGLVRLPKRFRGKPEIVEALEVGHEQTRSVFDEMVPATELALLAGDGVKLGVGVGELVPVEGRDFPLFVRLDPQFLFYIWTENRWYFRSVAGLLPITPGDGRWVLHCPGGRISPWKAGLWRALGRAYIRKDHALMHRDNWEAKLANPARVAVAPAGATEEARRGFFARLMAWGVNTVFSLTPGWDVKLIESNGRGYESFCKTIAEQNNEFVIAVAGQTVTTDGGAGFSNADIHKSIRADLIKETADGLAYTVNTQILPAWIAARFGEDAIEGGCALEWDVTPSKDRNSEASALVSIASAITTLTAALGVHGIALDAAAMCTRFGVPVTTAAPAPLALPAAAEAAPAARRLQVAA